MLLFIKFVRPKWTLKLSRWFLEKRIKFTDSLLLDLRKTEDRLKEKQNPSWNATKDMYEDMTAYNGDNQYDKIALEALQWAVSNPSIRNIAVTGPYGSGKSTVLYHFEKDNPNYNYLNVSLSTFRDEPFLRSNSDDLKWTEYLQQIEFSILQQLAYKEKWKRSKNSGFKKIIHLSRLKRIWYSIILLLGIYSFLLVFYPEMLVGLFPPSKDGKIEYLDTKSISIIAFILSFIFSVWILSKILGIYSNSRIQKLKFKDGEIELGDNLSNSLLNHFLSEIIYYFEVSGCNLVFFEDLDRFKNSDTIFEKLREINLLLNQAKQLKGRRIVFVYAIKDEVFSEKNRTKFFDFIIPVMPFIDGKNSEVFLMNRLQGIKPKLISDISFYIDDMRLLKNICNEFKIFEKRLQSMYEDLSNDLQEVFDNEQLLALVTFKNISPSKFSELYQKPENNLLYNEFYLNRLGYNQKSISITAERISVMRELADIGEEYDKEELVNLENQLLKIPEMELATLLQMFDIQLLFSSNAEEEDKDLSINKLMNLLIRNGFIKENYESYISLFQSKDGYLSQNDKIFIDSVKQRRPLDFKMRIDNPVTVIEKLKYDPSLFKHSSAFNYYLIEFILSIRSEYRRHLNNLFGQFASETTRTIELFDYYIENGQESNQARFFTGLIKLWPNAWLFIMNNSNYSIQQKDDLLIKFIRFGGLRDLEVMKAELSDYINRHHNFIDLIDELTIENAQILIAKLGVKIRKISNSNIRTDFFQFVLDNNCYQINERNIKFLVNNLGKQEKQNIDDTKVPNYTRILQSRIESLIEYIGNNMEDYLERVLFKAKNSEEEEEESIIWLLNDEDLSDELKEKIVNNLSFELEDITEVENPEFWHHLFQNNKVEPNWLNVYNYYSEKDFAIDEYLLEFLNTEKNYLALSETELTKEIITEEELFKIMKSLILCNDLSNESYSKLQKSIIYFYPHLELTNLQKDKVQILIANRRFNLTKQIFAQIKQIFELQIGLLESRQSDIIEKFDELNFDLNDTIAILESKTIDFNIKELLLLKISPNFYLISKRFANIAAQLIFKSEKIFELSIDVICELIKHTTTEKERVVLFNRYAEKYDETQIREMLNAVGNKFEKMNESSAFGWEIPNTDENRQLVEFLVENYFLSPNSKPKRNGKKIKIYK